MDRFLTLKPTSGPYVVISNGRDGVGSLREVPRDPPRRAITRSSVTGASPAFSTSVDGAAASSSATRKNKRASQISGKVAKVFLPLLLAPGIMWVLMRLPLETTPLLPRRLLQPLIVLLPRGFTLVPVCRRVHQWFIITPVQPVIVRVLAVARSLMPCVRTLPTMLAIRLPPIIRHQVRIPKAFHERFRVVAFP